jgi:uncharacterized lipoprotein YmbA
MMSRVTVAVMLSALAACAGLGSSPPERYYTLRAIAMPLAAASTLVIAVGPVLLPAEVDRPQIVLTMGLNELYVDEVNRWLAPLQDNVAGVVAENLAAILGTPRVTLSPDALGVGPDYRIAIEVRSFESILGTSATLDAVWTARRASDGRSETGRTFAREKPHDASYAALTAAHSRAAARLSHDIADAVRGLDRTVR